MKKEIEDTVKELKQQFHSMMNGPVSTSMREKGLKYKVIFGIEWNRLLQIATEYEKNSELAAALWKEDIRECRLLAGLLQPVDNFSEDLAEVWVEDMHYPEEAQYTTLSLFQELSYASDIAFKWIADSREMFQLCGYLILARLYMKGEDLDPRRTNEFLDQAHSTIASQNIVLRSAVNNSLLKFALLGQEEEKLVQKFLNKSFL